MAPKRLPFARDRSEGVFSRGDNQNLVLCALQRKLISPSVLPKIPNWSGSFEGSVQTDLDPSTLGQTGVPCRTNAGWKHSSCTPSQSKLFIGTRPYDPVFEKTVFAWDFGSAAHAPLCCAVPGRVLAHRRRGRCRFRDDLILANDRDPSSGWKGDF